MGARYRPYLLLLCMCVAFLAAPGEVLLPERERSRGSPGKQRPERLRDKERDHEQRLEPPHLEQHPHDDGRREHLVFRTAPMPELAAVHGGPHPARSDGRHHHLHREPGHQFRRQPRLYLSRCPFPYRGSARTGSSRAIRGRGPTARPTSGRRTRPEGSPFSRSPSRPSAAASASTTRAAPTSSSATPPPS